jgi:hypothetical protein
MGEMEGWMDENFIKNVCRTVLNEDVQVKVIRDRNSGYVSLPTGYILALNRPQTHCGYLNANPTRF